MAAKTKTVVSTVGSSKQSLTVWYLRLGILLVVLAVAVVVFGSDKTVPLTTQYLAKDALGTEAAGHDVLAPAIRHLFDIPLSWLVAKFLVLLGAVYLLVATLLRKKYEALLERGINPFRWLGLGLAAGGAVVTTAMASGVSDISTLMLAFGSIGLAALLVAAIETLSAGRAVRCYLGVGAMVAVFLPLLILVRTAGSVALFNGVLPMYLYFVYGVIALFAVGMGVAAYWRVKQKGKWADAYYADRMFMIMGFVASAVLALQIFAGALQP